MTQLVPHSPGVATAGQSHAVSDARDGARVLFDDRTRPGRGGFFLVRVAGLRRLHDRLSPNAARVVREYAHDRVASTFPSAAFAWHDEHTLAVLHRVPGVVREI